MKHFASWVCLAAWTWAAVAAAAEESNVANVEPVRVADGKLQIGLDPANGTLLELVQLPDGYNQLADDPESLSLWQITLHAGETRYELSAERAGAGRRHGDLELRGDQHRKRCVVECGGDG